MQLLYIPKTKQQSETELKAIILFYSYSVIIFISGFYFFFTIFCSLFTAEFIFLFFFTA